MKYIILSIILSGSLLFSKEIPQLKLTPNNVLPIKIQITDTNKSELYKKAIHWAEETYGNLEHILKINIKNEKISISGLAKNAFQHNNLEMISSYDMEYTLNISFNNDGYILEYNIGAFYLDNQKKTPLNYNSFYAKNGSIKHTYKNTISSLESTMNTLSHSFYTYLTKETKTEHKDLWLPSLITENPQKGFELAIKLSRMGVKSTQPNIEVLKKLRLEYSNSASGLTAASQVIAINFQTIAKANDYWK